MLVRFVAGSAVARPVIMRLNPFVCPHPCRCCGNEVLFATRDSSFLYRIACLLRADTHLERDDPVAPGPCDACIPMQRPRVTCAFVRRVQRCEDHFPPLMKPARDAEASFSVYGRLRSWMRCCFRHCPGLVEQRAVFRTSPCSCPVSNPFGACLGHFAYQSCASSVPFGGFHRTRSCLRSCSSHPTRQGKCQR